MAKYFSCFFKWIAISTAAAGLINLSACSTMDLNPDTAEKTFALAQEFEKSDRYEEAIKRYQDVKNKFPYSKLAVDAELAIADVHFKQESWPEAQTSYQLFRDMHPKHTRIDYVIYKLGLSYYNQLPDIVDRDLSQSKHVIETFTDLITNYSSSSYVGEATTKRADTIHRLAGKEDYIAGFYFKKEKYDSALGRYEDVITKYPGQGYDERALARAAICAARTNDSDKARAYYERLTTEYPNSKELDKVRKEVGL